MLKNISLLTKLGFFAVVPFIQPLQADDNCGQYVDSSCCNPCETCCDRFWAEAEYLCWKIKDSPESVPLVIEIPPVSGPNTVVLGGHQIKNDWRSGGRFSLGYWFDECCSLGIEANYFFLPGETRKSSVSSDGSIGSPILGLPFFDVVTGLPSTTGIAFPGAFSGTAIRKLHNNMQGAELNVVQAVPYTCCMNFGWLAGFRYWNFDETLTFDTSSPFVPPNPADIWLTQDKFGAQNNFYGGQIGAMFDYTYDSFFLNLKGKLALGALCQEALINGHLITNDFDGFGTAPTQTFTGGYFAQPTNIGHHKKTRFAALPEVNVNIGYKFSDWLKFQVGYTFLCVNNVLWAGKEIDPNINPSQSAALSNTPTPVLVGEASPLARLRTESLWVQGFNAGFELKF